MVILKIMLVQVLCCHSITKITRNGINGAMFVTAASVSYYRVVQVDVRAPFDKDRLVVRGHVT